MYAGDDDDFKHQCNGLATCQNLPCDTAGFSSVGYDCACLDEGYEPDSANGCTDKRPPVIACASEGCELAKLFVIKGEAAILQYPGADGGSSPGSVVVASGSDADDVAAWVQG